MDIVVKPRDDKKEQAAGEERTSDSLETSLRRAERREQERVRGSPRGMILDCFGT